jgi:hypothetical protein
MKNTSSKIVQSKCKSKTNSRCLKIMQCLEDFIERTAASVRRGQMGKD